MSGEQTFFNKGDSVFTLNSMGEIFYTSDKGQTWNRYLKTIHDEPILSVTFKGDTIYAASGHEYIWASYDDGNNWSKINSNYKVQKLKYVEPILFADGWFYKTIDDSLFTIHPNKLFAYYSIIKHNNTFYSGGGFGGNDLIANIDPTSDTLIEEDITEYITNSSYFPSTNVYCYDNVLYFLYRGAYRKSTNNGETWEKYKMTDTSIVYHSLVKIGNLFYCTGGNKLFCSEDDGINWSIVENTNTLYPQYIHINKNVLYLATKDMGIYTSLDSGKTWEQSINGYNSTNNCCIAASDSIIYIANEYNLFCSLDTGKTWQKRIIAPPYEKHKNIYAPGIMTPIIAASKNFVYHWFQNTLSYSFDCGETWKYLDIYKTIDEILDGNVYKYFFFASDSLLSIGDYDNCFNFKPNGDTLTELRYSLSSKNYGDQFIDYTVANGSIYLLQRNQSELYLYDSYKADYKEYTNEDGILANIDKIFAYDTLLYGKFGRYMYVSYDNGRNFEVLAENCPYDKYFWIYDNYIFIANEISSNSWASKNAEIYYSDNKGNSWNKIFSVPYSFENDIIENLIYFKGYVFLETSNGIIRGKLDELELLDVNQENNNIVEDDIQLYPNPCSDLVHVHLNNSKSISEIVIYNSMGELMKSFNNINAYNSNLILDVNNLETGFYICIFKYSDNSTYSKHLSIIK